MIAMALPLAHAGHVLLDLAYAFVPILALVGALVVMTMRSRGEGDD